MHLRGTPRGILRSTRPPGESSGLAYFYILPGLLVYLAFVILPLLRTAQLAFYKWDGVTSPKWIGLRNYVDLFHSSDLRSAFLRSLVFVVFYSIIPVCLGLLLSALLTRGHARGMTLFRTLLFLPQVIPTVATVVVWRWMYAPSGPVNAVLRLIGFGSITRAWLGDFTWALPGLGVVGTWVNYGLCMVLFIAGVQKISPELYDAARVDGAGAIAEFFAVTLPGLRNELAVALTVTTIGALRSFDLVYVATRGGPGFSTRVPAVYLFLRAFSENQVGSAAAIGIVLAIIIFIVVYLILRLAETEGEG